MRPSDRSPPQADRRLGPAAALATDRVTDRAPAGFEPRDSGVEPIYFGFAGAQSAGSTSSTVLAAISSPKTAAQPNVRSAPDCATSSDA